MKPDELKPFADFMREHGLEYLEVRRQDFSLVLQKDSRKGIGRVPAREPSGKPLPEGSAPEVPARDDLLYVKAPLVGVFYAASSPGSPPYVEKGSVVEKGTPLCIIEAMKVMNEIKSEWDGIVREIRAENGKPVEYGQVLFVLDPSSRHE